MNNTLVPKDKKRDVWFKNFKLYILPIIAVITFLLIIVALVFPKVNSIFTKLDEFSNNNEKVIEQNDQIAALNTLSTNLSTLSDQLASINSIAPEGKTDVVEFRDKVAKLAQDNNVQIESQRLSEVVDGSISEGSAANAYIGILGLQEVPTVIELSGNFENIKKFIEGIDGLEDFIIVKKMELSVDTQDENLWRLKIEFVKYQFSNNDEEELQNIYLNVNVNGKIDPVVEEYIKVKGL